MAKAVVKGAMPTSALGSKRVRSCGRTHGFTLLELMVVVAIIAITTSLVSFAIPDTSSTQLQREAARLVALLESARTQARAGALTVLWKPLAPGQSEDADYQFIGLPASAMPSLHWLDADVKAQVQGAPVITLGPEPVIGAQRVVLYLGDQHLTIGTDGLSAFEVLDESTGQATSWLAPLHWAGADATHGGAHA